MPPLEPISAIPPHRIRFAVMRQTWRDLTFLHWPYDPALVRPLVPRQLALDLHDGAAWVGLVPFTITGLTLPHAPAVPWLSRFPETNVRTYVADAAGRRGIWFFSLDAARLAAVLGARAAYALPYFWARMRVETGSGAVRYTSRRLAGPPAGAEIEIRPGEPIPEPTAFETFLTARFRLFANRAGRIFRADIEHPPWPLQRAAVVSLHESLVRAAGLSDPSAPPLAHFSRRLDVRVAAPVVQAHGLH
jgi:uncharacterized protein YqjF (DUF2071 family)